VCIHDRRLNRTTDGRGKVSAATLTELERLDFGSWHASQGGRGSSRSQGRFAGRHATGPDGRGSSRSQERFAGRHATDPPATARVLTLERLLKAAVDAGRPLRLLIETKHPTKFGHAVETRLIDLLREFGLSEADPQSSVQVTVMSFSPLAVRRVHQLAPTLESVFLFDLTTPGLRDGRPPFGARVLGPGLAVLRARPEIVARAHGRGHRVYVWTVNTPADVDFVHGLGVDGIISDRPDMVLAHLGG